MPTDRWRALTTEKEWDDVQGGSGVIVISDTAGPTKYHAPACEHVTFEHFTTKVLRGDAPANGRYWWAPDPQEAEAGGARRCGAQAEDAFAARGSQRQTQLYVNQHVEDLHAAIVEALPELEGRTIAWRSPLASDAFEELHDARFLQAVGHPELIEALEAFWPRGGPRWDALATVDGDGVLLVEGKSYPGELLGGGCKASPRSLPAIEGALGWTRGRLGVDPAKVWTGPLYQSANRMAFLTWLRWHGVRAWLVHLLFSGDPIRPTTAAEWEVAMDAADETLGVAEIEVPGATHVVLPAR
jgi:hypothetical protein